MNLEKLKNAETAFLQRYPEGFNDPELLVYIKKHKMEKMGAQAHEFFAPERFGDVGQIIGDWIKLVSRSSLVSVFEKPKFKDYLNQLSPADQSTLVSALKEQLHGDMQNGFETMLDLLLPGKIAKWSLMTVVPVYFHPQREVFLKPTTVKDIIKTFELTELTYRPTPSWKFYHDYRKALLHMKSLVSPLVAPNNPGFSGFLMVAMKELG